MERHITNALQSTAKNHSVIRMTQESIKMRSKLKYPEWALQPQLRMNGQTNTLTQKFHPIWYLTCILHESKYVWRSIETCFFYLTIFEYTLSSVPYELRCVWLLNYLIKGLTLRILFTWYTKVLPDFIFNRVQGFCG